MKPPAHPYRQPPPDEDAERVTCPQCRAWIIADVATREAIALREHIERCRR